MPVLDRLRSLISTGKALGLEDEGPIERAKGIYDLENKALQGLHLRRELSEPSAAERWAVDKEIQDSQFVLNKLSEVYGDSSPAGREIIKGILGRYQNSMTKGQKTAAQTIMASRDFPLNPIKQKMEFFDKVVSRPEITVDPEKDVLGYANQLFELEDYSRKRQAYATGGQMGESRRLIGIGEGLFAFRGDDGRVSVMKSEDMQLEALAKSKGTTAAKLLADGGYHYGEDTEIAVSGKLFKVRKKTDLIGRGKDVTEVIPTAGAIEDLTQEQAILRDLLAAFSSQDENLKTDGGRLYKLGEKITGGEWDDKEKLRDVFAVWEQSLPGWHFAVVGAKARGNWYTWIPFVDNVGEREKIRVVAWRGDLVALPTRDNKKIVVYYDDVSNRVYATNGVKYNKTLEEVSQETRNKTFTEIEAESKK